MRLLFLELVELSAGERERIFQERAVEPGVRCEVESLLSSLRQYWVPYELRVERRP